MQGVNVDWADLESTWTLERWGAPLPVLCAIRENTRKEFDCWRSVTELVASPLRVKLLRELDHYSAIGKVWAMFAGSLSHAMLEAGGAGQDCEVERRRHVVIADMKIGMSADLFSPDTGILWDYKSTSEQGLKWMLDKGFDKPDVVAQVNLYACLLRLCDEKVNEAHVFYFSHKESKTWPIPLMPHADALAFLDERIKAHLRPNPGPCEDREAFGKDKKTGHPRRCSDYCSASACGLCEWFAKEKGA